MILLSMSHKSSNTPPFLLTRRGQDLFRHAINSKTIAECWREGSSCSKCLHEVCGLMDKSVLISNLQSGDPPVSHVGVLPICHMDIVPTTQLVFIAVISEFQTM
jgi:hypothetical protein